MYYSKEQLRSILHVRVSLRILRRNPRIWWAAGLASLAAAAPPFWISFSSGMATWAGDRITILEASGY